MSVLRACGFTGQGYYERRYGRRYEPGVRIDLGPGVGSGALIQLPAVPPRVGAPIPALARGNAVPGYRVDSKAKTGSLYSPTHDPVPGEP